MPNKPLLLLIIAIGILTIPTAHAATPQAVAASQRGVELFGFGRWADARVELLSAREALSPADRELVMEVEYHLAACAVELGDQDADMALLQFQRRYPESTYANLVNFSLGSYYCAHNDMERARQYFALVDDRALDAIAQQQYHVRMGYVEFTAGEYKKAYEHFDKIGAQSKYADHATYYKSYINYAQGGYWQAKQGFQALSKSAAYGDLVPFYLFQIEFREGNYAYVTSSGDELLRKAAPQRRADIERAMAESWFRQGDYNKTLTYLDAFAIDGGELDRDGHYLRGFALYRTARYPEAAEALRRACGAEDALTQNASYHLADCYLREGDKQAAMQAFSMASDERFDADVAEDALFNYAKLQYELGGGAFNGAINLLARYVENYPKSKRLGEARSLLIAAYYNSHDYDAAYDAIKSYPSDDSDIKAALQKITYFRALESYKRGDLATALSSLNESSQVNVSPKYNALTQFWQGEIAYAKGDLARAQRLYTAYLSRAPRTESEYAMAWYNLGYCSFALQQMEGAQRAFNQFLSLRTSKDHYLSDAYNRLADTRYAARDFEGAIKDYDRAIILGDENRFYAQYKRAVTLGIVGRSDAKIEALKSIINTKAGDYVGDAAYELGRSYIAGERYADGAAALERFISAFPTSPRHTQACSDLGLAYFNMGDKERSLHYYGMVVSASPQSAEARDAMQGIREIYVDKGDVDSYFSYAEKAGVESDLTSIARDSLSFAAARGLYIANNNDAAQKSLRSYVRSYPKGAYMTDALYFLSDLYLRGGDTNLAIETLIELSSQGTNAYSPIVLSKLSELTFADKQYDNAATAYRQLFDISTTSSAREAAMTGYVRSVIAGGDSVKIVAMATDVEAQSDAGPIAQREARFAHAEHLRASGDMASAAKIYKLLATNIRTSEGSAAGYYLIEHLMQGGDLDKIEKAVFAFADKNPKSYFLAKSYLLLGDVYVLKGDNFQARATYQSIADGYSPADDGVVEAAKEKISKLN